MIKDCEYKEICKAYKIYSSHPELNIYLWLADNCDTLNIQKCVNREIYQAGNKLEKDVQNE